MNNNKPILLVEDDLIDSMTVKRALKEIKIANEIVTTENGEHALEMLSNMKMLPCIILLDLNMPKMSGLEFLAIIKNDSRYKMIPVIILTTSKQEKDKIESYKHSIAGYIAKPVDYMQFVEALRVINLYWTLSELPS